jgi:hypothetical protein
MLSVFEASLSFEEHGSGVDITEKVELEHHEDESYDDWLLQRKVKTPRRDDWDEEDLGDSCCFGTRTVETGLDCVWKLHGGV